MLQVTPTGPYDKSRHARLPLTLDELLADLRECFLAGADGVHLHVRDEAGAETLEPARVNLVAARVRELAGELSLPVEIGLTTGAWICPDLTDRLAMIREWEGVDCATVNLSEDRFEQVMQTLLDAGVGIDVGLWAPRELKLLVASGYLPAAQRVSIELDPGEPYFLQGTPREVADRVNAALDDAGSRCPRLTHGMNVWTWPLVEDAFRRGHDTRVGFEDSVLLPDGRTAGSNAGLVRAALSLQKEISAPVSKNE
ncbi:3-keto-5-aminohexanoate cleavage protein [Gryllotalpicola daejeonensis]|uniref:3-keto-5-aminohexanoate cleavage protein n=1 Tax=Gryllotalpicola daejeonensis TaxID=993087 RepID=A0ABP7ZGC9_9MICO